MKQGVLKKDAAMWVPSLLCLVLAVLGVMQYAGTISEKYLAIAAGIGMILLLAFGDLKRLRNWPTIFLMGYVVFSMLTGFWAMSGKFFLQRYSNIFVAVFFFLLVVLWKGKSDQFVRHVTEIIAGISFFYAFASIEGVSTGLLKGFPYADGTTMTMSSRMYGIFHNANIDASFFAVGIIFSIALVCNENKKWRRTLWMAAAISDAVALLLGLSIGALACFTVAAVVYLLFSGNKRGAALIRMLECALPAGICALLSFMCFRAGKSIFPLLLMIVAAIAGAALELRMGERLSAVLAANSKLLNRALVGIPAVLALYMILALHVSSPYTFGELLERGAVLEPGEHTLQIEADGEVKFNVNSRSREQIMREDAESLGGNGSGESDDVELNGWTFVVPEDSAICYFQFRGEDGTTIRSATVDGRKHIVMRYILLPAALGSRLQGGLTANESYVMRAVLAENGMKLFRLRPIAGNGVGSFETGITRVQDYAFVTRYVHEHYVQVLLEDGVIGFVLFAGALATMFVALWKKRKRQSESEFSWLYPALWAEMAMNGLNMLWDVPMSIMAFLCCTYMVYGLIVVTCAEPITTGKVSALTETKGKPTGHMSVTFENETPLRVLLMLLPAIYVLSVCGNLYAWHLIHSEISSDEEAFALMEKAVKYDLYEKNDIKLTYVTMAMDEENEQYRFQADIYADQLSRVQSNRIPYYLAGYYFNTMQYARSIEEAKLGALYSASDIEEGNKIAALLKQGFIDSGEQSPLLTREDGTELLALLSEYCDMRQEYFDRAVKVWSISAESKIFFETVRELTACNGNTDAMRDILTHPLQEEQAG